MRGWISDDDGPEQQMKDLASFQQGVRRRWWTIGVGSFVLLFGRAVDLVPVSPATTHLVIAGAVVANLLVALALRSGWYRWWEIYLFAGLDVLLAAALVALCGPGGLIAVFFIAVLPYAFDQGRGMGDLLVLSTSLAYPAAAAAHGWITGAVPVGRWSVPTGVYLETFVFIVVALALTRIPGALMQRIRVTRSIMALAERGDFSMRAPAVTHDELGLLEQSFNHMLEEIAATIAEVQREADEVAAFADVLADAAGRMLASSQAVAATAADLAREMGGQRDRADAGHRESTAAASEAESLRGRAAAVADDARRLVDAAERGRERVGRASETLVAIGEEVRATAATVGELSGISERIGRIARQTHLLALNAAIEAARAAEHGHGFAVVADQVRALAGEAARSAREVVDLIAEVRAGIDAVATAMAAGEEKVRNVGLVAGEAQTAFDDLHRGVTQVAQVIADTAAISRSEASRMATITQNMSEVASISTRSSTAADSAARAMAGQITAMGDLNDASRQLAQLAERLRASIGRFSLLSRERVTASHPSITDA